MIIIIPLGGIGERFKNNGYKMPKAMIKVFGKPILYYLLENINYSNELSKRVLDRMLRNIQNKMEYKPVNDKIDDINNSLSNRSLNLNESYSNKISKRPIPSVVNNSQDMNFKYEELQNKRNK